MEEDYVVAVNQVLIFRPDLLLYLTVEAVAQICTREVVLKYLCHEAGYSLATL